MLEFRRNCINMLFFIDGILNNLMNGVFYSRVIIKIIEVFYVFYVLCISFLLMLKI